jgi:hypothetical protein
VLEVSESTSFSKESGRVPLEVTDKSQHWNAVSSQCIVQKISASEECQSRVV